MDKKKISALERAIQMEEEGKKFYLDAEKKARSETARKIFAELAGEEDKHAEKIREIHTQISQDQPFQKWVTSINSLRRLERVFQESLAAKASQSKGDIEALKFGLEMEEKSIKYYEKLASKTENLPEKRFYLALSYEERGHYLSLMDSIEYLSDPESWFRMKEGARLDGG